MALQYTMTLEGPPKTGGRLLGIFDPITAHPVIGLLGLGLGIFLGLRKKRR